MKTWPKFKKKILKWEMKIAPRKIWVILETLDIHGSWQREEIFPLVKWIIFLSH